MNKKILFLGNLYHAEASLAAELAVGEDFIFVPVVERSLLRSKCFIRNPFVNLPSKFGAIVLDNMSDEAIKKVVDTERPDITIVRCWTGFADAAIPNSIFWKAESKPRAQRDAALPLMSPPASSVAFWTQNREEIPVYQRELSIPVGYFPRGVSMHWERPVKKTVDIVASGIVAPTIPTKIESFEMLVKPLCKIFSPTRLHIYVNHGQNLLPWAKDYFRSCYTAEEGPAILGSAKIFISTVTTRHDPGIFSHKTLQAMACKTLTITQYYDGLENIVGPNGKNLVYVNCAEECIEAVKFYLKYEDKREAIAERGYEFAHDEYNYTRNLKRALAEVGLE